MDDEVKGGGNSYTTEFRQLDPRIGRWLSLDPLMSKFPNQSTCYKDPDGREAQDWFFSKKTVKIKMKKYQPLMLIVLLILISCNNTSNNRSNKEIAETEKKYLEFKSEFDSWLVTHFPENLKNETFYFTKAKNATKHNIGLYLYEYDVELSVIRRIRNSLEKNAIAKYHITDSLLLIINRFETQQTDQDRSIPQITDSTLLDSGKYERLYPVPNFIDYEKPIYTNGIWLPKDFSLYVLEAKGGNYCKEFDLKENFQMPEGWKNGFSKGVAISERDNTIIYWGVIW